MSKVSNQESDQTTSVGLEKIAAKRAVPGVLSFTGDMVLLYMNAEAEELCEQVLQGQKILGGKPNGNMAIPQEIHDVCQELHQELLSEKRDPEEVQLRRVIGENGRPILVRGFLIPGQDAHEPRYLILLEKLGRRTQVPTNEAKRHFHLTDREHEIVVHLADGRTNREIADLLEISEHTVKEHIKHVLRKTETTTRTGILAQLLRFS